MFLYEQIEKKWKCTPKNPKIRKSEKDINSICMWVQKDICVKEILLLLEVWARGEGLHL